MRDGIDADEMLAYFKAPRVRVWKFDIVLEGGDELALSKLMAWSELRFRIGISRPQVRLLELTGDFPRHVELRFRGYSRRETRWVRREVDTWLLLHPDKSFEAKHGFKAGGCLRNNLHRRAKPEGNP